MANHDKCSGFQNRIAARAKLPIRCANWYLHKFRHIFATRILRSVDIRRLQVTPGHKKIATIRKYLKPLRLLNIRLLPDSCFA
ncbi:tyrosine-type recombinase/integrase [Acidicapsa acidisoli]|uniref:tyrosine-type recombinase/integrase n=1 Tax=Acidicapsa acidisoli TaxID=1615681 RepID=UPI0037C00058